MILSSQLDGLLCARSGSRRIRRKSSLKKRFSYRGKLNSRIDSKEEGCAVFHYF